MTTSIKPITSSDIDGLHDEFMIFGNPKATYWFLGLEEGDSPKRRETDDNIELFVHKLIEKHDRYKTNRPLSLRDLCAPKGWSDFLPKIDETKKVTASGTKYQNTWGGYIKLLLSIEHANGGNDWTLNEVKIYQKYRLGSLDIPNDSLSSCLLELFPMARKGRKGKQWPYAHLAKRNNLEYFDKANNYRAKVEQQRTKLLLQLVKTHRPKVLAAFGKDCESAICNELQLVPENIQIDNGKKTVKASIARYENTTLVFSIHPTSHGVSDLYWRNLGNDVSAYCKNQ